MQLRGRGLRVWLPDMFLVGVAFIWGINIPLMKIALQHLDNNIYLFNAIRLPLSAVVLVAFAWRERRAGIRPSADVRFGQVLIYAVVVAAIYQIVFLVGLDRTPPANAALIISTVPIWTAILARIFIHEQLRRLAVLGLLIALVGTVIVALQRGEVSTDEKYLVGNLTMLLAALLWAGGTVYSRPLLNKISPLQLAAAASVIALPVHILIGFSQHTGSLQALRSPALWLIIFYSGTLSSGLSQPMWHFGVRQAGAAHASIIQNLIPVAAIFATWTIIGTAPTGAQLLGGALILSGLITMRLARK